MHFSAKKNEEILGKSAFPYQETQWEEIQYVKNVQKNLPKCLFQQDLKILENPMQKNIYEIYRPTLESWNA